MSLTTLLVLTSLYTQTAANLPKTAYLKAIDIWLLSIILSLVVIIITHIFTDYVADFDTSIRLVAKPKFWLQYRSSSPVSSLKLSKSIFVYY